MTEREIKSLARDGKFQGKLLKARIEETHISWIILTSHVVFKIKKPLKLSFLDFSTLSRRKRYCEKELALNSRFSDMYQVVVPVVHDNGAWYLARNRGAIVDYAVQMKRMISATRMDLMLQQGRVRTEGILSLAEIISSFHRESLILHSPFQLGRARELFNDIQVVWSFVLETLGKGYASVISTSISCSNVFLRRHEARFQQRIIRGYKRDVHGDLHTGNIFLYKRPVIFDCIEFNDGYRQIDVIDEIAFFCMDLEAFGRKDLANVFFKAYKRLFPCFECPEDHKIFVYFKCYRANIRAKVHAIAARQEANDPAKHKGHVRSLKRYLTLMKGYVRQIA